MKYHLRSICAVLAVLWSYSSFSFTDNRDSLTYVHKNWETKELKESVLWKTGHFSDLFNSKQMINILEIDLAQRIKEVKLGGDEKKLVPTSEFAVQANAMAAINGGFFNMKEGGAVDLLKINGKIINHPAQNSPNADAAFILSDNKVKILPAREMEEKKYDNIMISGPLLIYQKQTSALKKSPFSDNRHPRTAVALTSDKKLLLMTVDGRNSQAEGFNLNELAEILKWSGATDALNLDGGGSTTLYIENKGVVNYPSDNKNFDQQGERPVANIIYIQK